jgi:hypothetical protein
MNKQASPFGRLAFGSSAFSLFPRLLISAEPPEGEKPFQVHSIFNRDPRLAEFAHRMEKEEREAIINAIMKAWEKRPHQATKGPMEEFRYDGPGGQGRLIVRTSTDCTPSVDRRKLISLGFEKDFVDAFVRFRRFRSSGRKSTSGKCKWREDLMRLVTWGEYTGAWIREALPEKSRKKWDKKLRDKGFNWYQARLADPIVAAAIVAIDCDLKKNMKGAKLLEIKGATKYIAEWKKKNLS